MLKLSSEQKVLLEFLKSGIFGTNCKIIEENIDWNEVYKLADAHAINMFVFEGAKDYISKIPQDIYIEWLSMAGKKLTNQENLLDLQCKVVELLEKNNIEYVIIKGFSAAAFYNKGDLREIGDIDIIVDKSSLKETNDLLIENGFKRKSGNSYHIEYSLNNFNTEIHFRLSKNPETEKGKIIDSFLDDFHNIFTYSSYKNNKFKILKPSLFALSLMLHIASHLQNGGIGFRHLADWAVFLESKEFKESFSEIVMIFKKCGLLTLAETVCEICSKYLGTKYFCFSEALEGNLCDELFDDLIQSGNFGRLSEASYYGSSIFTAGSSFENKNRLKTTVYGINILLKNSWPACKKFKPLIIFAPFFVGIRYIFRAIRGNRPKIKINSFVKNSLKRADLYNKLQIMKE